jgi:hypothetical protein
MLGSAFAGRNACDNVCAVGDHLRRVKRTLFTCNALHYNSRVSVNQYAQDNLPISRP